MRVFALLAFCVQHSLHVGLFGVLQLVTQYELLGLTVADFQEGDAQLHQSTLFEEVEYIMRSFAGHSMQNGGRARKTNSDCLSKVLTGCGSPQLERWSMEGLEGSHRGDIWEHEEITYLLSLLCCYALLPRALHPHSNPSAYTSPLVV